MINLCALSDEKYLSKGMTLYDSLLENSENFTLHYLCLDNESFNKIKKFENKNFTIYHVEQLLLEDKRLEYLYLNDYKYFCWCLASYFTNFLMVKEIGDITYIDSDIYFHKDIGIILKQIDNKDIGIFRHRQFQLNWNVPSGLFNVGVVHFKSTDIGRKALFWWHDAVLFKKYPELAQCGDQKYLDAFVNLGDNLFCDGSIGHGAPWQWQLYNFDTYINDGCIYWNGEKQELIFTHFSQFEYDLEKNIYTPSTMHHIYTPMDMYYNIPGLKYIYDNYFKKLKISIKRYGL